jgi:hypothetical protein
VSLNNIDEYASITDTRAASIYNVFNSSTDAIAINVAILRSECNKFFLNIRVMILSMISVANK